MISITNIRKRMTKGFLLMVFFLAQAVASSAQANLYMEDFAISRLETKQVALLLDNELAATAMEVHIQLPAGLYYDGNVDKTDRVKGRGAQVQASTSTGELVIVLTDATIEPGEGEIVTFSVYNGDLTEGEHTITLSDIVVSNAHADQINPEETATATVTALGLKDCVFGGPESFNIAVDEEYQVDVTLQNEGFTNLSAFEGKLILPEGLEIVPGEDGKFIYSSRTPAPMEFKFQEFEGYTSFVLSSSNNKKITGNSGIIFSFIVKASAALTENSVIELTDLRLATTTGQSALVTNGVTINVINTSIDAAKQDLQDVINTAKATDTEGMPEVVVQALNDAIAAAEAALDAENPSVKSLNDAKIGLETAVITGIAKAKLEELKAAAEALVISEEIKAYEAENVKTAVADAETFILIANNAVAAVEAKIAEGNLSTDNKEALAAAIAAAETAIADAQGAIEQAETIYAYQKAADEAAALAAAKADLQAAIAAAKAANTEGMTEESIQALNDAIAAAEAALAAEDATVESLNAAKAAVEAAVAGLMVKPLFADGTYYLFNPASKLYMAAGSSWGTHAVVNAAGLDYIITYVNGKYTLDSQVSNGGTSHFLNGEWNDGQAMNWTFAEVAEGVFTLSNGEKFMTVQENGEVTLADDAAAEAAQWILKTKEDRLAEMAAATAEAPVDATFLVADGNFNRNDLRKAAWTGDDFSVGGDNTNMNAEKWGGNSQTFDIKQTIELPNGIYKVTWNGYYRYNNTGDNTNDIAAAAHAEGTEVINSFVYLNDKDYALTSIADENAVALYGKMPFSQGDASAAFGMGAYEQSAEITVEEGQLTIGIKKIEHLGTDWTVWDNFRLSYLGVPVVINPDDPEIAVPDGMINLIANGNLAGDDVTSFVSKEAPSQDIVGATIVAGAGKNNSRGIVVKSADNPAQAWDTQFWIKLNQPLTVNSTLHVEFDYAANKTAATETQAHGDPGNYKHWACIGSPTFTTEWQHFSADVTVSAEMADMLSIAFNLAKETTATEYYFDNFGVWAKIAEKPKEWQNIMVNSNMEGDDNSCFYVTEQGVGGPFLAPFTAGIGVDGSKAVKVQSADAPANAWDTQFFIRLPYQLPAGTSYKVSFDYKAAGAAKATTQMHANPGDYIHYIGIGDVNFTTDWQTFEFESVISGDQSKDDKLMQSIAFNLAELATANTYIFDNVKFFVPKDVVSTLTLNPAVDPKPYPVGIQTVNTEKNAEGIFNLNGQKVMKTQKGLYIMNGKKVVIK